MRRWLRILGWTVGIGLLVGVIGALIATRSMDSTRQLPGGWTLKFWDGLGFVIYRLEDDPEFADAPTRPLGDVHGPDVRCYQVVGPVITGYVVAHQIDPDARTGYFVIDTQTRKVWRGLDEVVWRDRLRDVGVETEPDLKSPALLPLPFLC